MAKFNQSDDSNQTSPQQVQETVIVNNQQPDTTQVGLAQTSIDEKLVDHGIQKEEEHWIKTYWRPAMGWMYMLICIFDFVVFPFISMIMPVIAKGFGLSMPYSPWQSLTLSNGGLFHAAMGGIIGVTAWTRGLEKTLKIGQ